MAQKPNVHLDGIDGFDSSEVKEEVLLEIVC